MRWFIVLLIVGLAGCIQPQKPVWNDVPSTDQLLDQLTAAAGRYVSLDGAATVSLATSERYLSTEQFVLLQRPNRIRIDALTGFGQLIFQLASDGDVLSAYLNTSVPGRFLQGPATDQNITHFVRVPLALRELLPLLLYDPPRINFQHSRVEVSSTGLTLLLQNGLDRQELYFDKQLNLSGSHYIQNGRDYLRVKYSQFSQEDGFPYDIQVIIPQQGTKVRLKFSEIQLNPMIAVAKFSLQKPANISVEPLPE